MEKSPEEAFDLASEVLAQNPPDKVREAAEKVQKNAAKRFGYVMKWEISDAYEKGGLGPQELFNQVFPPETGAGSWRPLSSPEGAGEIAKIDSALQGKNKVAYLRANLFLESNQDAVLELGSDDGVKAWLNGKLVLEANEVRSLKPGENQVKVKLRMGENSLLLKVTQGEGEWQACARLRTAEGGQVPGLKNK